MKEHLQGGGAVTSWLACIRIRDTLVMQAPPLVGAILAGALAQSDAFWRVPVLLLAGLCLIAHIYAFNDWSGAPLDQADPNKMGDTVLCRGGSQQQLLVVTVVLGACALLLYAVLGVQLLGLGALMIAISTWYSWPNPAIQGKNIPILSTVLHLGGSVLYFLSGYALRAGLDVQGLLVGTYFGTLIMAGHLAQEVQDKEGDRSNHIRTTATMFGPKRTFLFSVALFAFASLYLLELTARAVLPPVCRWLVFLFLVHLGLALAAWKQGLTYKAVLAYRKRYQILYGLISLALCAATLWLER